MRTGRKILILAVLLMLVAGTASASDRWLHVRVQDDGDNVRVNIPLNVVETMLPMIQLDEISDGIVHLDDHGIEGIDLYEILTALRDSPDANFVTVKSDDDTVRVAKEDGYLLVNVEEGRRNGDRVQVRMPLDVVEAMVGNPNEIDLVAGLRALADNHLGEDLVTVESDDTSVRVWIDTNDSGD